VAIFLECFVIPSHELLSIMMSLNKGIYTLLWGKVANRSYGHAAILRTLRLRGTRNMCDLDQPSHDLFASPLSLA
jgi:hypothetical protein